MHRLPHLLDSHLTLGDAFTLLDRMTGSKDALERSLAQLSEDMLGEVKREHEFFEALRQVYHAVVDGAARNAGARRAQAVRARASASAFRQMRYVVEGERNLPADAGSDIHLQPPQEPPSTTRCPTTSSSRSTRISSAR